MMADCDAISMESEPGTFPGEIYALLEPDTGAIRYIGKASNSVSRFERHMKDRLRRDYPVYRWINKLVEQGKAPDMIVLEVSENWPEAERRLIELSRARGCRLLNVAEGGFAPHCSAEQRSKNGRTLNEVLKDSPKMTKIRELKRYLAWAIKKGDASNSARATLRAAAAKRPDLFGIFAAIPDRVE
jgi:hypothetical protein